MAYLNNMKLGWIGFIYPAPPEMTEAVDKLCWQLEQADRLGCHVLQPNAPIPKDDPEALKKVLELKDKYDVEYEMPCPRAIFELVGDNAEAAKKELQEAIDFAKNVMGSKIMRCGYGRLKLETSRYNRTPGKTGKDQFEHILACLKIAAPMFEAAGMYYAQENHVDFTGKELAHLFELVNSPNMGIALDTANSFAVFSEPNEDIQAMAPWAITSHIKDTKIIDKTQEGDYFPLIPVGCSLGEGAIDIPAAIDAIVKNARYPEGFHLVLEQGWWGNQIEGNPIQFQRNAMEKSLAYLKKLITVD